MNNFDFTHMTVEKFTEYMMMHLGNKVSRTEMREALYNTLKAHSTQDLILPDKDYHIILEDAMWNDKDFDLIFAKVSGKALIEAGYYSEDGTTFETMKPILDAIGKQAGKKITYYDVWNIVGENTNDLYNHEEYDITK